MPEGDTIHKVAAAMAPRLERVRARIEFAPRHGPSPVATKVERVYAHGKHLLLDLAGGHTVRVHLGMYGAWHRYRVGEPWRKPAHRASVVLHAGENVFVCFGAREVQLLRTRGIQARNVFNRLGPDLLEAAVDLDTVVRRAREFNAPDTLLVDVLLDQRVACGIGNVYKSEILFLARMHPWRGLANTRDRQLEQLYRLGVELLSRNLGGGPRVTRYANDGRARLWVYGRRGAACLRCADGVVQRAALGRGARGTFWCSGCQAA